MTCLSCAPRVACECPSIDQQRVDAAIHRTLEEQQRHAVTLVQLANLEAALRQIGGTLSDSQTDALRAARSHLEAHGMIRSDQKLYAPTAPPWASDVPPWLRGKPGS